MTANDVVTAPEADAARAQEVEAAGEYVHAQLESGQGLRVLPPQLWRPSVFRALRESDYDTWAEKVVHPEDVETFIEADPTMAEILAMIEQVSDQAGASLGNSRGRSASSKARPRR